MLAGNYRRGRGGWNLVNGAGVETSADLSSDPLDRSPDQWVLLIGSVAARQGLLLPLCGSPRPRKILAHSVRLRRELGFWATVAATPESPLWRQATLASQLLGAIAATDVSRTHQKSCGKLFTSRDLTGMVKYRRLLLLFDIQTRPRSAWGIGRYRASECAAVRIVAGVCSATDGKR